ncbi:MAG: thioredoxin family protein [Rhodoferax sp.]
MPSTSPTTQPTLLVTCLCAQWCNTCGAYRALFDQMQERFPALRFQWIDVEDEADLVDPIEVENFPTLLISAPHQARFFGTVTPHAQTLLRLIESLLGGDAPALPGTAALDALVDRLWQLPR